MISITHIINPFAAKETSDLFTAQPITFESMKLAAEEASEKVHVKLCSTQYKEDHAVIPDYFTKLSDLEKSVLDQQHFDHPIKLPLIKDIVSKAYYETSSEYIIYSNVDIALQKDFYLKVNEYINKGYRSIIINRKRISGKYTKVSELDDMYSEQGKKHPGFDCFVFHRDLFPDFCFNNICIGVPFIGITFSQNLFALDSNCLLIDNQSLTFHIGMEIFAKRAPREYFRYNQKEFWKAMEQLSPHLNIDHFPYSKQLLPVKIIRWGIHPSIPIRLVLRLLVKKYKTKLKG